MKRRTLFSLYDTEKVVTFSKDLIDMGWEIIASKETFEVLSRNGLFVKDISDFVGFRKDYGFPPTLHPKIEWCLTSPDTKERIDLVYVINYPLSIGNDVGGRTLLALAAKGNRIPVMSQKDMELVIDELKRNGNISLDLHSRLLEKANSLISRYYFDLVKERKKYEAVFGESQYRLKNGENPYQIPAELFATDTNDLLSLSNFGQVEGEAPCFTNLADCDSIVQTMCLCSEAFKLQYGKSPFICIASKHGNPCGMAINWDSPLVAVRRALFGNPRAIWGGEVITNFEIDKDIASMLFKSTEREKKVGTSSWMLDVILAPCFTKESIEILGAREKRKLFENTALLSPSLIRSKYSYRFVRGGFIRQPPPNYVLNLKEAEFIGRGLKNKVIDSLIVAWAVVYSSNHGGNEVAIAKNGILISCGGGPSTIEAVQFAIIKAKNIGHELTGGAFAADAFFPFNDAPGLLIKAGVIAGVVPSGGREFENIRSYFERNKVSVYYLPEKYRGFCRH